MNIYRINSLQKIELDNCTHTDWKCNYVEGENFIDAIITFMGKYPNRQITSAIIEVENFIKGEENDRKRNSRKS